MTRWATALAVGLGAVGSANAQDNGINIRAALWAEDESVSDRHPLFPEDEGQPRQALLEPGSLIRKPTRLTIDTGFDFGRFANLAAGLTVTDTFRIEAEVSYLQHDVEVSRAFQMENQDLDENETSRLVVSQGAPRLDYDQIVAEGLGRVETKATFANGVYDLPFGGANFAPYIGAGVGVAQTNLNYTPGGTALLNESDTVVAYQFMLGAHYQAGRKTDVTFGARYRGMGTADITVDLLPPEFSFEGEGFVGEIGLRRTF